MEWIEPVNVKSSVKFTSSLVNSTDEECENIISGSIIESNLAWFACGDRLDIVSTTHSGVQSRHFSCPQGQEFEITCLAPIPNEKLALVGLSSNTGSGAVALYNYVTSMILNSWSVSHKVTCVCSMEIPNASYRQFLKSDCFLFAVGTEEGHIMLLAIDQHFKFSAGTHQLELNIVHYVTTDDILHKRVFFKPPVVLVIPLNDSMYRAGRFVLESMHESNAVLSVRQEEVDATVVKYIPQNQTLCVGYNTQGAFQMFSLKSLELDFSGFATGCNGEQLDRVLDFVFLEPEDDPRHFCYLTVVAQISCDSHTAPYALLYSLTYVRKEAIHDGGILYEDLQYITLKLDLNFGSLIQGDASNGENVELLTCESLVSSNKSSKTRATGFSGLCYLAMSCQNGIYLAIFDLNQWYQARMPARWIFSDSSRTCPFIGFYRSQSLGRIRSGQQVWIQPFTLSAFHRSSITPNEGFFYPSALSFRATVVCRQEAEMVLFLGMQSLLLQKLSEAGSQVLNYPHRFYIQAVKAGLAHSETLAPSTWQMAEALLDIGLENNSRSFLISCIKDEGANLNVVEKWAWQQVISLKSERENLCTALFDHSTQEMEPQMHGQLYHVTHQFKNLSVLYDVMDKRIQALNSGVNDKLRDKSCAVYLLSLHLETVLWFLHGGLLPEVDEDSVDDEQGSSSLLPYPRRQLQQFYRNRKNEIESLSSSVKADEVLLIEQLVPASVAALWAEEKGATRGHDLPNYPPPSLYALLSAYLRPDVDDVTKHRLVQYVFMDLTWIYGRHAHYANMLQHLVTFPSTYSLKPSMIKVTQAFWHLDHQNFDDALGMLLDPLVHTMDITNGQQRAILRAFLYQDQRRHALKYATLRRPVCPELEDIQLHLTILIANGLISDALSYIRRNRNQRNSVELMRHLLSGCQEMRKFSVLLTLPLSQQEEEDVTDFLKRSRSLDLQEALLLFYIQRCKYPEAIAYSQRLNQMWPARDAASRERYNRRQMLMQTLIGALPPITCQLAAIANSRPKTWTTSTGGSTFPRPLSVAVLPATSQVQSSGSHFLRTVIEQSRATLLIEQKRHLQEQTPLIARKRKLDVVETAAVYPKDQDNNQPEATPFLCNIVQPVQRHITLGMSLCFPSPRCAADSSSMDMTATAQLDADHSQPRQGKRPRFSLLPSAAVKTDAEVVSVLQTPPVRRCRPCHPSVTQVDGSGSRPSSILKDKMRRFMNFSAFDTAGRPISDADPSESETEMEVSTSSAKQLRFRLPQSQDVVVPPLALDLAPIATVSSIAEAEDEDMDVVVDMPHSDQPSLVAGENSQFLSFEDESETATQVEPCAIEKSHPLGVESPGPSTAQQVMHPIDRSSVGITMTNLETTSVITLQSHSIVMDDNIEESTTLAVLQPALAFEKEAAALVMPAMQQRVQLQDADKSSCDESDIVCLDSSSDEEEEVVDGQSVGKEEEDELDEEEGDYEEGDYEEEDQEEIEEEQVVAQEEIEDAEDDGQVVEEEEDEREQEVEPLEVEEEFDAESEESANEGDTPRVYVKPDVQLESVCEPEKDEAVAQLPERVEQTAEILLEESFVPSIDSNEEDEVSEYSHSVEGSLHEEDFEIKNETLDDSSSSSPSSSCSSDTQKNLVGPSVGHQTTLSTSSYKQRFRMSSSSSSSSKEEIRHAEDSEDQRLEEAAALRKPRITGYSPVEPDLNCDVDAADVAQAVAFVAQPYQVKQEDQEDSSQEGHIESRGYSPVQPEMEDADVIEEEEEEEQEELKQTVDSGLSTAETKENLFDSSSSSVAEGEENGVSIDSIDEQDEKRSQEEEDFELKLAETPKANFKCRSYSLRRFSVSSISDSDSVAEEPEVVEEEESCQHEDHVIEPETSPTCQSQSLQSEDVTKEKIQGKIDAPRSSVLKSRFHLTDSEASSDDDVGDIEDPVGDVGDLAADMEDPVGDVGDPAGDVGDPVVHDGDPVGDVRVPVDDVGERAGNLGDPSGDVKDPSGDVKDLSGDVKDLSGDVKDLSGDVKDLSGDENEGAENEEKPSHSNWQEEKGKASQGGMKGKAKKEEKNDEGAIEAEDSDESSRSEGSTTDENEQLRNILQSHEKVDVPFIADAAIIRTHLDLSTIAEERSFDQSIAPIRVQSGKSPLLDAVGEEEEVLAKETEREPDIVSDTEPVPAASTIGLEASNLDLTRVDDESEKESNLEPLSCSDDDAIDLELTLPPKQPGRSQSLKMGSLVPLPFTARRSVWETRKDRDRSPESITSEPPRTFEDIVEAAGTKRRTRRHSSSVASTSQIVTRRQSTRLSTSISQAPSTSVQDVTTPSTLPTTPPKTSSRRRRSDMKNDQFSAPVSCEVSPSESCYSGRSSAAGTPIRRSARISALRDRTPEPSASTDALLANLVSRIRRHSSDPAGADIFASPVRRSGRQSANVSRDNSPTNSVTSEPPPQSTSRQLTPSRRKQTPAKTLLRSGQKSVALNLFPLEEEKETESTLPLHLRPRLQAGMSYQDLSVTAVDSDESISHDELSLQGDSSTQKQPRSRSRPSSVGSGRYNLRRAAASRPSELDIISEEAAAAAASNVKRNREDGSAESSDQAGSSCDRPAKEKALDQGNQSEPKTKESKRTVRSKKRKKTNNEDVGASEELHFAPVPRPPPKGLPKRDPVIKSRTSVRRLMRLDK